MFAFFATPLGRKVMIYGAIAVALFFIGRQWLNHHDNKVAQETREQVTEAERVKAEAIIKTDREAVAKELASKQQEIDKLNADLSKVYRSLDNALKLAKQAQENNAVTVVGIPDSELNGAIRAVLARQQSSTASRVTASPATTP